MEYFATRPGGDPNCIDRITAVVETPFQRITYTEAIELLKKVVADGHKFEVLEMHIRPPHPHLPGR